MINVFVKILAITLFGLCVSINTSCGRSSGNGMNHNDLENIVDSTSNELGQILNGIDTVKSGSGFGDDTQITEVVQIHGVDSQGVQKLLVDLKIEIDQRGNISVTDVTVAPHNSWFRRKIIDSWNSRP